jgi:hypothetical protein
MLQISPPKKKKKRFKFVRFKLLVLEILKLLFQTMEHVVNLSKPSGYYVYLLL